MVWASDVGSFADECARVGDPDDFRERIRSVPDDRWAEVHAELTARLDQVVPGEPESPPLTRGEERGAEVLSEADLIGEARNLEQRRRILADEDRRRRSGG